MLGQAVVYISSLVSCTHSVVSARLHFLSGDDMRREVAKYIVSCHQASRSYCQSMCRDALACPAGKAIYFAAKRSERPWCTHETYQPTNSTKAQPETCLAERKRTLQSYYHTRRSVWHRLLPASALGQEQKHPKPSQPFSEAKDHPDR